MALMQPSSLIDALSLERGPPLVSPTSSYHGYLHFIGALGNAKLWCLNPSSLMLSIGMWYRMAVLSGCQVKIVHCAMHRAIV